MLLNIDKPPANTVGQKFMKIGGLFVGQVLSRQENVSCRLLIGSGSVEKPSEELVPLASLGKPNVPPLAFPLRLILSEAYRNIYSCLLSTFPEVAPFLVSCLS